MGSFFPSSPVNLAGMRLVDQRTPCTVCTQVPPLISEIASGVLDYGPTSGSKWGAGRNNSKLIYSIIVIWVIWGIMLYFQITHTASPRNRSWGTTRTRGTTRTKGTTRTFGTAARRLPTSTNAAAQNVSSMVFAVVFGAALSLFRRISFHNVEEAGSAFSNSCR